MIGKLSLLLLIFKSLFLSLIGARVGSQVCAAIIQLYQYHRAFRIFRLCDEMRLELNAIQSNANDVILNRLLVDLIGWSAVT